jgi:cell division cycle 14
MGFHEQDSPPSKHTQSSQNYVLFLNDKSLVFTSFFADFGPLDLGLTYKFCSQLHETIKVAKEKRKPVLYSCSNHPHHRSNGAVLICAYLVCHNPRLVSVARVVTKDHSVVLL